MPRDPSVFVHEKALCESDRVGPRTRVWAFAHIMPEATVGADCNVCDHVFIESGATLGNRVIVKNSVLVWKGVTVEDDVFLGPNMVFTNVRNPRAAFPPTPEQFSPTRASSPANGVPHAGQPALEERMTSPTLEALNQRIACQLYLEPLTRRESVEYVGHRIGWACACGYPLPAELACGCGRRYRLIDERTGLVPNP